MNTHSIAALLACGMLLVAIDSARAAPVDELLQQYEGQGGRSFSAAAGEQFWDRPVTDAFVQVSAAGRRGISRG